MELGNRRVLQPSLHKAGSSHWLDPLCDQVNIAWLPCLYLPLQQLLNVNQLLEQTTQRSGLLR